MLDGIEQGGAVLVWRGEAGVGKSALLEAARDTARMRGFRTLYTAGTVAETELAFAGLQRLLDPVLDRADRLSPGQREVLLAAIGAGKRQVSDLYLVALASLELLCLAAAERPILVLADDVNHLDAASRDVLGFVGRRVENDPIVVLAASRDGAVEGSRPLDLPQRRLDGLEAAAAGELIDARFPALRPGVRARVLEQSQGNPLALVELPVAAARASGPISDDGPPGAGVRRTPERHAAGDRRRAPDRGGQRVGRAL